MDLNEWMEGRIQLFFDYCYPSVKNQSNKNFEWIIFFDSRTPKEYLNRISEMDDQGIIEFRFTDHWDKLDAEILQILDEHKHSYGQLISTRLDCDDAVSEDFVERIQGEVLKNRAQTPFAINFSNGVILDKESKIYYLKKIESNAFISLVQDKTSLGVSIFKMEHQTISGSINTVDFNYPKMWLQVVHGKNLINKSSGLPQFSSLGQHFNISCKKNSKSPEMGELYKAYLSYIGIRANNLKVKIIHAFRK
jgi:hypothetical protein